ncbi:hypothetical protein QWZ03_13305 [Chitinimonas viridis]|uniref:Uncharacterized protein n=1 Tax=Chitinimonas viridis TaxID=664880 RepID=A0ABT8B7L7_9NEIS|nr:hypothetical protein [Chitinimonas viridis]MDN3577745.1 hypothetical protein [Chitinimonas viridis]
MQQQRRAGLADEPPTVRPRPAMQWLWLPTPPSSRAEPQARAAPSPRPASTRSSRTLTRAAPVQPPPPTTAITSPPPVTAPTTITADPFAVPPDESLTERALRSAGATDLALRQEADAARQLLPVKPLPHNLIKLPPIVQTAMARVFERELGELVVLNVVTTQEGGNRVTRVYTNKGLYCVNVPLVRSAAFRGTPVVPMAGGCGP